MWNRDGRNSALNRAQALLSAKIDTNNYTEPINRFGSKGPQGRAGPAGRPVKKSTVSSNAHILSLRDLSDVSSVSSVTEHGERSVDSDTDGESQGRKVESPKDCRPLTSLRGGGGGSRFLKKAIPSAIASTQSPEFSKNQTQFSGRRLGSSSQRSYQNAALSRFASIEERIHARKQAQGHASEGRNPPLLPASDQALLSLRHSPELKMAVTPPTTGGEPTGKRFLKKASTRPPADSRVRANVDSDVSPANGGFPLGKHRNENAATPLAVTRSSLAGAGRVFTLDSDEEDMKKLLGDSLDSTESLRKRPISFKKTAEKLSGQKHSETASNRDVRPPSSSPVAPLLLTSSPSSPDLAHLSVQLSAQRSPSPSPPPLTSPNSPLRRSLSSPPWSHSEVRSLEELFPMGPGGAGEAEPHTRSSSSVSSEDFKVNIMTLDDLVPLSLGFTAEETEPEPSKHNDCDLGTASTDREETSPRKEEEEEEELGEEEAADYQSDFESISARTEHVDSASQISEHLGGGEGEVEERRKGEEEDLSEITREASGCDGSCREWGDRRRRGSLSDATQSRASGDTSSSPSHSDPSSSRTLTPRSQWSAARGRTGREAATQTQPDPLSYHWSTGMAALDSTAGTGYVDPTPVASHTVSAEAIEAMSSYSPAVFALNDMLRQQLAMTQQFVRASRHLHASMVQGLGPADYTYTTLENTKEFIRKHRPPKLSAERALEEVLQEMRDYHYI